MQRGRNTEYFLLRLCTFRFVDLICVETRNIAPKMFRLSSIDGISLVILRNKNHLCYKIITKLFIISDLNNSIDIASPMLNFISHVFMMN